MRVAGVGWCPCVAEAALTSLALVRRGKRPSRRDTRLRTGAGGDKLEEGPEGSLGRGVQCKSKKECGEPARSTVLPSHITDLTHAGNNSNTGGLQ